MEIFPKWKSYGISTTNFVVGLLSRGKMRRVRLRLVRDLLNLLSSRFNNVNSGFRNKRKNAPIDYVTGGNIAREIWTAVWLPPPIEDVCELKSHICVVTASKEYAC